MHHNLFRYFPLQRFPWWTFNDNDFVSLKADITM